MLDEFEQELNKIKEEDIDNLNIEELKKEIKRLRDENDLLLEKKKLEEQRRDLLEEKESIKDDIKDTKKGIKPNINNSIFWNMILFIALVLIAGALVTEGREISRYGILLLMPIIILMLNIVGRIEKIKKNKNK
jgi:hypothetical protein